MNDQFLRTQMLLGANAMERLRRSLSQTVV